MYVYLKATEDGNSLAVVSLNMDHTILYLRYVIVVCSF